MVGDIERTRLNHIRILFFAGVNDGIVPNNSGGGGIISQFERERLAEHDMTLAPGMRERVFIQKFYLYISMTKPSDGLYISYSKTSADGKALRPSYLISVVNSMYEKLEVKEVVPDDIITPENGLDLLLSGFRGAHSDEWNTLASWYLGNDDYRKRFMRLLDAAYHRHTDEPIGRAVTRALYGTELYNSVTRLEHFASCAFAHYLSYGLRLRERELYQFASVDMGNIYHDALCNFSNKVQNSEYTWHSIPEDIERQWVEESMEEAILADENAGVFEEARNIYLLGRMKDTMRKTVWALIKQIKKGNFTPSGFEVSFGRAKDLKAIEFGLGDGEKMRLNGRIDRVDTYETDDKVYVRIIDYKSGNTTFSLVNLYYGLQLQLVVYMNAAVELTRQSHPGKAVEPAGLFYYHIKDPIVDVIGGESETQIEEAVFKELKLNGLVSDNPGVYRAMDAEFSGTSDVIPVGEKNDGSLKAASSVASAEDFATIAGYVNEVIADAGRQIMAGNIAMEPYMMGDRTGCDYCPYHTVCGFDARMDGYAYRKLASLQDPEELMALMRHEVGSDDGIANDEA
jgi:ATP-dependent helicase/nuclease subunit B